MDLYIGPAVPLCIRIGTNPHDWSQDLYPGWDGVVGLSTSVLGPGQEPERVSQCGTERTPNNGKAPTLSHLGRPRSFHAVYCVKAPRFSTAA